MVVDAESLHDDALFQRPGQFALVLGKLCGQGRVDLRLVFLLRGYGALEQFLDLLVEAVRFLFLGRKFGTVLLLALGQPLHVVFRLLFLGHQLAVFLFAF